MADNEIRELKKEAEEKIRNVITDLQNKLPSEYKIGIDFDYDKIDSQNETQVRYYTFEIKLTKEL